MFDRESNVNRILCVPHTFSDFVVDKIGTLFIYYSHGITTNMAMDNVVVVFFFYSAAYIRILSIVYVHYAIYVRRLWPCLPCGHWRRGSLHRGNYRHDISELRRLHCYGILLVYISRMNRY